MSNFSNSSWSELSMPDTPSGSSSRSLAGSQHGSAPPESDQSLDRSSGNVRNSSSSDRSIDLAHVSDRQNSVDSHSIAHQSSISYQTSRANVCSEAQVDQAVDFLTNLAILVDNYQRLVARGGEPSSQPLMSAHSLQVITQALEPFAPINESSMIEEQGTGNRHSLTNSSHLPGTVQSQTRSSSDSVVQWLNSQPDQDEASVDFNIVTPATPAASVVGPDVGATVRPSSPTTISESSATSLTEISENDQHLAQAVGGEETVAREAAAEQTVSDEFVVVEEAVTNEAVDQASQACEDPTLQTSQVPRHMLVNFPAQEIHARDTETIGSSTVTWYVIPRSSSGPVIAPQLVPEDTIIGEAFPAPANTLPETTMIGEAASIRTSTGNMRTTQYPRQYRITPGTLRTRRTMVISRQPLLPMSPFHFYRTSPRYAEMDYMFGLGGSFGNFPF